MIELRGAKLSAESMLCRCGLVIWEHQIDGWLHMATWSPFCELPSDTKDNSYRNHRVQRAQPKRRRKK